MVDGADAGGFSVYVTGDREGPDFVELIGIKRRRYVISSSLLLGGMGLPMRLWTVQPVGVWEQLEASGYVYVDPARINGEGWVPSAYSWLAWQLRGRIADSRGRLPWFAYCDRPDLRWVRHSRPQGSREVLIEFEPPSDAFVTYPCWAWNEVYSGWYLAPKGKEARAWYARLRASTGIRFFSERPEQLPEPWQGELEATWRRLFAPDLPARSWRRGEGYGCTCREAAVEVLRSDWVRSTKAFVGTDAAMAQRRAAAGGQMAGPLRRFAWDGDDR